MAKQRPTTVDEYIAAAPPEGHEHLERVRGILRKVAPQAEEVLKWNTPFYVEPRFLFSFSAFKAHLAFAASQETLETFRDELAGYATTKELLKIRYDQDLPEDLLRRMAEYRLQVVSKRTDTSFW